MRSQNALTRIQKLFPKVKRVRDATETLVVTVIDEDSKGGQKNNPEKCALAHACMPAQDKSQSPVNPSHCQYPQCSPVTLNKNRMENNNQNEDN